MNDMEQTPVRRRSPWYVGMGVTACTVLFLTTGTMASREVGLKRTVDIAKANNLPLNKAELFPPYEGDPGLNAAESVIDFKIAAPKQGEKTSNLELWDTDAARVYLASQSDALKEAEKITDCPVYVSNHKGDGAAMLFPEFSSIKSLTILLLTRARIRALDGDLKGSLSDFRRAVKATNFMAKEPVIIGGLVNAALVADIEKTAVGAGPSFKGHTEMDELKQVTQSCDKLDYARMMTGEAYFATNLATKPINLSDWNSMSGTNTSQFMGVYMEATRSVWGPRIIQAYAEDINDLRKSPKDPSSPALGMIHVQALALNRGIDSPILDVLLPVWSQIKPDMEERQARQDLALIALNAIDKGTLPDVQNTRDMLGNGPYKLTKNPDGWTVYSYGMDGRDDGGYLDSTSTDHGDVGVTYHDGVISMRGR